MKLDKQLKEWQEVEIPLDFFALTNSITEIRFTSNLKGVLYIDDVRLVSVVQAQQPSTAVAERTWG